MDPKKNVYHKKLIKIKAKGIVKNKEYLLGRVEFDISPYVNNPDLTTLQLKMLKGPPNTMIHLELSIVKPGDESHFGHLGEPISMIESSEDESFSPNSRKSMAGKSPNNLE